MNNLTKLILWLTILSGVALSSCKTTKVIIPPPPPPEVKEAIKDSLKDNHSTYVFDKMKQNQFKYKWLSAKFNVEYITDVNNSSFSGTLRMLHDSVIWISISKMGFEGARILITEDTVKFINRQDKLFFISDFNYINRFVNNAIDFDMLQAIIVGNDFKYYENDKFKVSLDNDQIRLSTINRRKLKKYVRNLNDHNKILVENITLDPVTFKINDVTVKEVKANNKLKATYSNYEKIADQLFPILLELAISAEKEIKIKIEFTKCIIDEPQSFPFTIPESYDEIIPK